MRTLSICSRLSVFLIMVILAPLSFSQPLPLSGTSYTQDFQTVSSALPSGWSVRDDAASTSLGVAVPFTSTPTAWLLSAGLFSNMASVDNTDTNGAPVTATTDADNQVAATNRAAGVRLNSGLDPGAAFVLQISNTLGFQNFVLSLDLMTLSTFSRTSIWTIDYAVGAAPASFIALGTYFDPASTFFGLTNRSFALPADVDDQGENLWIRVANITAVSQSGNRDAFAIDNVALNWQLVPPSTNPPSITDQPQSTTRNASTLATFTVDANGTSPLLYQWRRSGTNLADNGHFAGVTMPTLQIFPVLTADAGEYSVFITNHYGSITSAVVTLAVIDPAVITSPVGRTNIAGDNVLLSADYAGTIPTAYQWRRNALEVPGAAGQATTSIVATASLVLTNLQSSNQGAYTLAVTNNSGSITSSAAHITLLNTPSTRIATWNFNSNPSDDDPLTGIDTPSLGVGSSAVLGATPGYDAGAFADPASLGLDNSALNTVNYAPQGTENKLRGAQFNVSTVGYQDLLLTWEERHTARASRYLRVQYTTNGTDFLDHGVIDLGGQQNHFVLVTHSLAAIPNVNNNPSFGFRIVTEFEDTATGNTNANYVATDPTQSYGQASGIRFDSVNVFGNTLGTPALINITRIQIVGGNVQIDFVAGSGDTPGAFTLQSASAVNGTYADVSASILQLSPGVFQASRALNGTQQFYRISR